MLKGIARNNGLWTCDTAALGQVWVARVGDSAPRLMKITHLHICVGECAHKDIGILLECTTERSRIWASLDECFQTEDEALAAISKRAKQSAELQKLESMVAGNP